MTHYGEVGITQGASFPYAVDEVSPQILQSYPDCRVLLSILRTPIGKLWDSF